MQSSVVDSLTVQLHDAELDDIVLLHSTPPADITYMVGDTAKFTGNQMMLKRNLARSIGVGFPPVSRWLLTYNKDKPGRKETTEEAILATDTRAFMETLKKDLKGARRLVITSTCPCAPFFNFLIRIGRPLIVNLNLCNGSHNGKGLYRSLVAFRDSHHTLEPVTHFSAYQSLGVGRNVFIGVKRGIPCQCYVTIPPGSRSPELDAYLTGFNAHLFNIPQLITKLDQVAGLSHEAKYNIVRLAATIPGKCTQLAGALSKVHASLLPGRLAGWFGLRARVARSHMGHAPVHDLAFSSCSLQFLMIPAILVQKSGFLQAEPIRGAKRPDEGIQCIHMVSPDPVAHMQLTEMLLRDVVATK